MGALSSLATAGLNVALVGRAQQTARDELRRQRDTAAQGYLLDEAQARRQREAVLKQRIAQERARAGAMGVGGSGGSVDAIIRGLREENALVEAQRRRRTAQQIEALDGRYEARRRTNLLDFNSRLLDLGSEALGRLGTRRKNLLG